MGSHNGSMIPLNVTSDLESDIIGLDVT
jgi:hypothetical protein